MKVIGSASVVVKIGSVGGKSEVEENSGVDSVVVSGKTEIGSVVVEKESSVVVKGGAEAGSEVVKEDDSVVVSEKESSVVVSGGAEACSEVVSKEGSVLVSGEDSVVVSGRGSKVKIVDKEIGISYEVVVKSG